MTSTAPEQAGSTINATAVEFAELSPAQRRLWFLNQFEPNNTFYNEPLLALRIKGPLDRQALQASLDDIIARQASLRTTFPAIDGLPLQRVIPPQAGQIRSIDLAEGTRLSRLRRAYAVAMEEAHRLFDLERGPLLRINLVRMAETDHLLTVAMHHIITDGWSLRVLLSELTGLYAFHAGLAARAPPAPRLQYTDYLRWEKEMLDGERLAELSVYWLNRLKDAAPYTDFMIDFARPASPSFRGGTVRKILPSTTVEGLALLARRHSTTLYVVFLAAYKCLIARLSGRFDVLVGTPTANRLLAEAEKLIGFFVNVLVLRTNLSGNPSFTAILAATAKTVLEALDHQSMPFDVLVGERHDARTANRQPFVQLFFAHHNFPKRDRSIPGLEITRWDIPQRECKFDLVLFTTERDDGAVEIRMAYSTDIYLKETAARLLSAYNAILASILDDAEQRLSALVPIARFGHDVS
jgi:hypothetical protein